MAAALVRRWGGNAAQIVFTHDISADFVIRPAIWPGALRPTELREGLGEFVVRPSLRSAIAETEIVEPLFDGKVVRVNARVQDSAVEHQLKVITLIR